MIHKKDLSTRVHEITQSMRLNQTCLLWLVNQIILFPSAMDIFDHPVATMLRRLSNN